MVKCSGGILVLILLKKFSVSSQERLLSFDVRPIIEKIEQSSSENQTIVIGV